MGGIKEHPLCLRLIGAFSRHHAALDWLWASTPSRLGTIAIMSERYAFVESEYYRASMGEPLWKQFVVLEAPYDPARLASDKLLTNDWEQEYFNLHPGIEPRQLNIDPGYLSMTKLVLASTKNREHRIYLRDGIYAEVTLVFRDQQWLPMEWTYPDYRREDFRVFFASARKLLLRSKSTTNSNPNPNFKRTTGT
jgi:hypothetical protein